MRKVIELSEPKTGYQHPKCYANSSSNCSRKISREHFISKNYLQQTALNGTSKIAGLHWQSPKQFDIVGNEALTSRILCERHNTALSPLDMAFGAFASCIRDFDRAKSASDRFFDGSAIELWMLKCLMGLAFSNRQKSGKIKPNCVDILFGQEPWPDDWGLYFSNPVAQTIYHSDSLAIEVQLGPDGTILACNFFIQGIPFVLLLGTPGNPRAFGTWRPQELVWKNPSFDSRLIFSWAGKHSRDVIPLTKAGTYDGPPPNWQDWEKK